MNELQTNVADIIKERIQIGITSNDIKKTHGLVTKIKIRQQTDQL